MRERLAELLEKAKALEAGGDHAGAVAGLVAELIEELRKPFEHSDQVARAIEVTRSGDAKQ